MSGQAEMKPRAEHPFTALGLEPAFELDVPALERTHRELSRALHPDRYVGAPAGERRSALDRAVEVNEAFRAVRDPLRRAELLFELYGVPVGDGHEPRPDQAFLMDVLEKREALGDAKAARDARAVAALTAEARAGEERVLAALAQTFRDAGAPASGPGALGARVGLLGELRFFRRFLEELSAVEDDLTDAP